MSCLNQIDNVHKLHLLRVKLLIIVVLVLVILSRFIHL